MMRNKVIFFVGFFLATATLASAAGVVPCDGPGCRACDIVILGQNLLMWFIGIMASIIALMFAWGGMQMVMSAGNTGAVSAGKEKMTNAVIGLVIILGAWLIVDTVLKVVMGGNIGVWNKVECVANPSRTATPPPSAVVGGGAVTPKPSQSGKLSDADARSRLAAEGISVNKTQAQGTSLEGINEATIQDVIDLKKNCGCIVVFSGGTETTGGHSTNASGHLGGYKYDVRPNKELDSYIENSGWTRGTRNDNGTIVPTYTAPDGSVYAREGNHWDVKVPG